MQDNASIGGPTSVYMRICYNLLGNWRIHGQNLLFCSTVLRSHQKAHCECVSFKALKEGLLEIHWISPCNDLKALLPGNNALEVGAARPVLVRTETCTLERHKPRDVSQKKMYQKKSIVWLFILRVSA